VIFFICSWKTLSFGASLKGKDYKINNFLFFWELSEIWSLINWVYVSLDGWFSNIFQNHKCKRKKGKKIIFLWIIQHFIEGYGFLKHIQKKKD